MFRVKLLAIVISIFVAVVDEVSLEKEEVPSPPDEKTALMYQPHREVKKVQEPAESTDIYTVTATVYYPERSQTDSDPLTTADGSKINPRNPKAHRWIALSRDMLARWGGDIQYGDSVWVSGISEELDGKYVVRDTMNRRFRNRIDILVGRRDNIIGRWNNVQIARAEIPEVEEEIDFDFRLKNYGFALASN